MANPLFNAMFGSSISNNRSLQDIYSLYKSGGNPMTLMNNIAKSNPQMNNILSMIQRGANPQQLFYSLCQEKGVDPNMILNQLNGLR